MLEYIKSAVTRNQSEKKINSLLDFMAHSTNMKLLQVVDCPQQNGNLKTLLVTLICGATAMIAIAELESISWTGRGVPESDFKKHHTGGGGGSI